MRDERTKVAGAYQTAAMMDAVNYIMDIRNLGQVSSGGYLKSSRLKPGKSEF